MLNDSLGGSTESAVGVMRRVLVIGWSLVLVAGVSYVVWLGSASGKRTLFSPDTLMTRARSEWLLPYTRETIWRGEERTYRWRGVEFLVKEGYWAPVEAPRPTWVETAWEEQRARDGISPLQLQLAGSADDWVEWSKGHPELARHFWPKLLARLRRGDGAAVQEAGAMMMAARQSGSVAEYEEWTAE